MLTLIITFTVTGDPEKFRTAQSAVIAHASRLPGFGGSRLHRSLTDPNVYVEVVEWADADTHRAAVADPDFRLLLGEMGEHATAASDRFEALAPH
ncbi:antibiotic biosynthesis monooxygenase family protein [Nocardiopsis sediminis]|uniref:Antibiotic biosynthesis monooxygenase family protein n=1 Tax=Nocardiopsis sediminis TaxID=1778267 RepID=A0ABV8FQV0_9ACTN